MGVEDSGPSAVRLLSDADVQSLASLSAHLFICTAYVLEPSISLGFPDSDDSYKTHCIVGESNVRSPLKL